MVFYTKHDFLLGLLLFGTQIPIFIGTLMVSGFNWFTLILFLVLAYTSWVWIGTRYIIRDDHLLVTCGFIRRRLMINKIQVIRETDNPVSSAACSMDRIEILTDAKSAIISPRKREVFINKLLESNEHIDIQGELT